MDRGSTTVNNIAKFLREEITFSKLKSGQHLKENDISKKFKVSRVPVREAFRILQSEGYIEVIPNRGSFVKTITYSEILEMAVLYQLLAPVMLEKAIPNYKEKTYVKADLILKKVDNCTDFTKLGYLLWDFAKIIYGPCKMKYLLGLFDDIYLHNIRSLNEVFVIKQKKNYNTAPHRKFLELCRRKKTKQAIELWQVYLSKIQQIILTGKKKK
ncbi:MAG TPA: GntR family transcriptional regulator [Ignavibacteria bacterium]|mgnify:CR=1 FL=1|nr:GntR family transcriptional regulator [Ignavibacteria bacterium]